MSGTFVEYTSGGYSPWLYLPGALVNLSISALNWDGATVNLQTGAEKDEDRVALEPDPHAETPGTTLARTANGPLLAVEGRGWARLKVTGGSPVGLKLGYEY